MSNTYNKSYASLQTVKHETITLDAQKILIKTPNDSLTERTDILEYFDTTLDETMEPVRELNSFITSSEDGTYNTNIYSGGTENTTVNGFQYSRDHFVFDKQINSISIPHFNPGQWPFPFNPPTGYLSARIFTDGEEPSAVVYSDNSVTLNGNQEAVFNFTDFKLPYHYTYIQFAVVANKTTIPVLPAGTGCLTFIAKVISDSTTEEFHTDDLCVGYNNGASQKWVIDLTVNYTEYSGVAHDIDLLQETNDKNLLQIDNLRNQFNDLSDRVDEVSEDVNDVVNDFTTLSYTTVSDEAATAEGDFNAVHFKYQDVPHNFPIKKFILKTVESSNIPSTPLYMAVWTQAQSGQKTYVGLSDEAIIWEAGKDAVWTFNNVELIVPENHNVEFFLCTGPEAVNEVDATAPGVYIKTKYNPSGRGSIRWGNGWHNRCIQATFNNNGYLSHVGDGSHLTFEQYQKLKNLNLDDISSNSNNLDLLENKVQSLNEKTQELNDSVYEKYDNYNTITISYDIEKSPCDTTSFRLGYKHTPNGIIKKVSLYARSDGGTFDCNTNGCYLLVQKYNKATSELISSALSKNKVVVQKNSESTPLLNTWEFDGFESCKEGEVLKFMPTSGDSPIADYKIGILVDPYHTHEDCNVGGDTFVNGVNTTPLGAGSKWVAYVQFEGDFYIKSDFKTHPEDSSKHLKSIERPIIESLYTTTKVEVWNNNINNDSLGNASVKGFRLERPYISNCVFNEMRWTTTSGTEDCTCYLKVTLNDVRGKALRSYFSNNTESFNATGLKSFRFDEDIEITDKIGSIVCQISLDGVNVITTEGKRVRLATIGTTTNNTTDGTEATNNNIIAHVIFYGSQPTSLLTSHIGDNTHLTEADRELLNNLAANANVEAASASESVTVTVDDITLDASVTAQNRMTRAVLVMEEEESVQWLSSDRAVVTLSKSQLKQALKTAVGNEINSWIGA